MQFLLCHNEIFMAHYTYCDVSILAASLRSMFVQFKVHLKGFFWSKIQSVLHNVCLFSTWCVSPLWDVCEVSIRSGS